jgi:hypothetical protein
MEHEPRIDEGHDAWDEADGAVDCAIDGSFPASDPPPWTTTIARAPKRPTEPPFEPKG